MAPPGFVPISSSDERPAAASSVGASAAHARASFSTLASSSGVSPDEPLPTHIGRFTIEGRLGQGGMGVVFKGFDPGLDRHVAIKMILDKGSWTQPEDLERFLAEARAAAKLRHPNVVGVHYVGEEAGRPYLVLDFVDGHGLERIMARETLGPRRVAEIGLDVARGLGHAHDQQILHRDVKPSNIMIGADGRARLTDFGLARDISTRRDLTVTGFTVGTPFYMPPEMVMAERDRQGPHSDVWSLGAVLYQLIATRPPFEGDTALAILQQIIQSEPPRLSSATSVTVPVDLETIVMRCLEKDLDVRYRSAGALAEDLRRFLADESIVARRPGVVRRGVRWLRKGSAHAAAILLGVALVATVPTFFVLHTVAARSERARADAARAAATAHALEEGRRDAAVALGRRAASDAEAAWDALDARLADLDDRDPDAGQAGDGADIDLLTSGLEAWASARRLLDAAPDDRDAERACVRASVGLAQAAIASGEHALAAAALERASLLAPDHDEVRRLRTRLEQLRVTAIRLGVDPSDLPDGEPMWSDGRGWASLRADLVDVHVAPACTHPRVLAAMKRVPRHLFVPEVFRAQAYENRPLPIFGGQANSQPSLTAQMIALLQPTARDRVLEVGTGAGYTAALLAQVVARVYTIELQEPMAAAARLRLRTLGYDNVELRTGNGTFGWPEEAPFDHILVTAGLPELPRALIDQLAPGGRLVAPVQNQLILVEKDAAGRVREQAVSAVTFAPLVPEPTPGPPGAGPRPR